MSQRRAALIVGAGIGGLSAGIALRRAGWDIRIFERAASPRELGFGVALAPNAIAALRDLGVADVVLARSFAPATFRGEFRRPDGTVIKRAVITPRESLGGPMAVALRPALHGALLEAVGVDALTLGSDVAGFSCDGDRVRLRLTDGAEVEGDLLIGADGIGSVIRRQLHPAEPAPRSAGLVAVRGAVHGGVDELGDCGGVIYLGPGIESAVVRASETGIYWFLSLAQALVPALRDPQSILDRIAPRFDAMFRAITSRTTDVRCDVLADRDPVQRWGTGPVTLLGDAAHPMLPQTGQGAAQAMVDAVALGRLLEGEAPVAPTLRQYETLRYPPTASLVYQGRRTARVMRSTNPVVDRLREAAIRLAPVGPIVKILTRINRRAGTQVPS